jgi:hypothetical protein
MRINLVSFVFAASFMAVGGLSATPAMAQLSNPCPFLNDNDCDEPNGLGSCDWGTDVNDCSNPNSNHGIGAGFAAGLYAGGGGSSGGGGGSTALSNPCPFTNDRDCDEPNGLGSCDWGTDANDCSNPNSNFGVGAGFSAGIYPAPTPTPPTTGGGGTRLSNPCPFTNDRDCDEPNGLGSCDWGTDANDCSNPNSNFGTGAGFHAGIYPAPTPPPTTGGGSGGTFTSSGAGGSRGCPNWATQHTAFGGTTLRAGFRSFRVPRITAGGRHSLSNCFGTNWRGFTITRPDYRINYQGNSPTGRLTFALSSRATDTILLINAPDGQWYFNDDSNNSSNSILTFVPALQGQYDIWAGSFNNSSNNRAEFFISE